MPSYRFDSLSSLDFEELIRDLLQRELVVRLESFKAGRDRGIDLRYAPDSLGSLIVQCKHYADSSYSKLLHHLSKKESPKIAKLAPRRYILATSLGLTPDNKDELLELLSPFCRSTGDIYGRNDINSLLGDFPEIERRHFKLWLTSQVVMERVLHSNVFNQTNADIQAIERRVKCYVQNRSFFTAREILEQEHYCIVAGIPGIGKTTLAEIVLVHYMSEGYEAISVTSDIEEAFKVLRKPERQIFYYDDFLGQTNLDEKLNKNEDRNLLRFIAEINGSSNSRFVLTTREYILNQAKETYEMLDRSNFDVNRCVISLENYTKNDRAKILYNHVYFADLPQAYREALVEKKAYNRIITHRNFNPRIVEWLTVYLNRNEVSGVNYVDRFIEALENPVRLWEHAFDNQIPVAAQNLLFVLASMPREVFLEDLETAFSAFHERSAQQHNFRTLPSDYRKALRRLEGNFIQTDRKGNRTVVKFHNPSVRDFVELRVLGENGVVRKLFESAVFFDQFVTCWAIGRSKNVEATEAARNVPPFIAENMNLFVQGLAKNFESDSCILSVTHRLWGAERVEVRRSVWWLEDRLGFAVRVAESLFGENVFSVRTSLLRPLFDKLLERINAKLVDKQSLVQFLSSLGVDKLVKGIEAKSISPDLLTNTKHLLLKDLSNLDAFVCFVEFDQTFPDVVLGNERAFVAGELLRFAQEGDEGDFDELSDLDEVRAYANDLDRVAGALEVDLDQQISALEYLATEIEQRPSDEDEREIYHEYPSTVVSDVRENVDIDAMFQGLLE